MGVTSCKLYYKNWLICDTLITIFSIPKIKVEFIMTKNRNYLLGRHIVNEIQKENKRKY